MESSHPGVDSYVSKRLCSLARSNQLFGHYAKYPCCAPRSREPGETRHVFRRRVHLSSKQFFEYQHHAPFGVSQSLAARLQLASENTAILFLLHRKSTRTNRGASSG